MKIKSGGKEYEVDLQKAVADGYLKEIKPYPTRIGQRVMIVGETYVIAAPAACMIQLIDINNGNRFGVGVAVDNIQNIQPKEWGKLILGYQFELIK